MNIRAGSDGRKGTIIGPSIYEFGHYLVKWDDQYSEERVYGPDLTLIKEETMANYDSTKDTLLHIKRVNELLIDAATELLRRAKVHDDSKLKSPEKETFDEYTPKLKDSTYGSDEYKELLKGLGTALDHHYANNRHHPEHYELGVDDMDLFDLIEMFFDWKAASERHDNGSIYKSIDINENRFKISSQISNIFRNTVSRYL